MDKPGDNEEIQLVAVLRFLGCSWDNVANALHIAKRRVGDIEDWIKAERLESVEAIFDDQALKRVIGRELPSLEEVEPQLLVRAGQVMADDILRHYRTDYSAEVRQSGGPPDKKIERHFAQLEYARTAIVDNYEQWSENPVANLNKGRLEGMPLDPIGELIYGGSMYEITSVGMGGFRELVEVDKRMAKNLLKHLKAESPEFAGLKDFADLTDDKRSRKIINMLRSHRSRYEGHCPDCP